MVRARKYVVKNRFAGAPKREDYEIVEYELPALKDGEILVKAEWLSVDPYLQVLNVLNESVPYDQFGFQVGTVVETKDRAYPVGTKVVNHAGWQDYSIINTKTGGSKMGLSGAVFDGFYKLPNLKGLSPSLAVGAVGMPGASAYFALLDVCQPKPGETVAVTAAAGACGSIIGQIAKIKGCKAIGFAGSDEKVKWLENELGFHKAYNYKTVDVIEALKEAAPNGIDCFVDGVGGQISSEIMSQMNHGGRVSVLGSISGYNDRLNFRQLPKATIVQPAVLVNKLTIQGFSVQWSNVELKRWHDEAFVQIVEWIKSGQLKVAEHVTEGFENVFQAFADMLVGKNFGKAVVKV